MKRVAVLGSTGSIGRQTLDVIRANPERFEAVALCAGRDAEAVLAQAAEFKPKYIAMADPAAAERIARSGIEARVIGGPEAAREAAALEEADIVVNGVSGFAGMGPLLSALEAGKAVALANKESIVCASALVNRALSKGGCIIPVDSEQSAIFQCLKAGAHGEIGRLILTASGGPFRTYTKEQLRLVTAEDALRHPTWSMGRKITIDSASLFNKGLEIMEASYLFDVPGERISVLIHPESIVHSMVEFVDGSNLAQLSRPDMRLAIQYALSYPERVEGQFGRLELWEAGRLSFFPPDNERFPALGLAYQALREGMGQPVVYNGANEAAVELFIRGEIGFCEIPERVARAMAKAPRANMRCEWDILELDRIARELAVQP